MKKQSLYVFGGALLATTALSTAGHAASLKYTTGAGAVPGTSTITAIGLGTQVFSPTTATAATQTISGSGSTTVNNQILIDFGSQLTSTFNVELDISNAAFTGTPTITTYVQSTSGTLAVTTSATGCSIQALTDKVLLTGCNPSAVSPFSRLDAIGVNGVTYTAANDLATAGHSITLSGTVKDNSNTILYETITAAAVITSKSAFNPLVTADGNVTLSSTASPAFASNGTSSIFTVGSISYSATAAVSTDLSTALSAANTTSTSEVKITYSSLTDTALSQVTVGGVTLTSAQFTSTTMSFQVPAASLDHGKIVVAFNGTSAISGTSGTSSATVTPTVGGTLALRAVSSFTGSLASISRGGLSAQVNTFLPSSMKSFNSFIRVVNSGAVDGAATISVRNESTGAAIGTYTTATIKAGAMLTITATDIETNVTGAAATGANYNITVAGTFVGYVQHLLYNVTAQAFTDVSGFRNGALTVDP